MRMMKRDVVISCDPGCDVDDQFVIAHMALSRDFNVHGIVTAHSPHLENKGFPVRDQRGDLLPTSDVTRSVAEEVLSLMPFWTWPVLIAGEPNRLNGLRPERVNPGVSFLLSESRQFSSTNRLVVVAIGPVTDIAAALLIEPSLADRIEVVAMAFQGWPQGTDPCNVKHDVLAWQVLMRSDAPLTIADGAVCIKHLCPSDEISARIAAASKLGSYLTSGVQRWTNRLPDLCRTVTGRQAWPIWDQAVVAHLLGLTTTVTHQRPSVKNDTSFCHRHGDGRTLQWITSINEDALWQDLIANLNTNSNWLRAAAATLFSA